MTESNEGTKDFQPSENPEIALLQGMVTGLMHRCRAIESVIGEVDLKIQTAMESIDRIEAQAGDSQNDADYKVRDIRADIRRMRSDIDELVTQVNRLRYR